MDDQSDDWPRTLATPSSSTGWPPDKLQAMVHLLLYGPSTSGADGSSWADLAQPTEPAATSAQPLVNFSQGALSNSGQDGYNPNGISWADTVFSDPSSSGGNPGGDLYAGIDMGNGAGSGGRLTDAEIANIVFNETRSLSGPNIDLARYRIAQAVINGDERKGARRPPAAPAVAKVPAAEQGIYQSCQAAVAAARADRGNGFDPTHGAMNFNFRNGPSVNNWKGHPLHMQVGPFNNSFPSSDTGKTNVYSNVYGDWGDG